MLSKFWGENEPDFRSSEENKEEKDSSSSEEDISPLKIGGNKLFSNEEEDTERRHNLQLKEYKILNQIQTISQKLTYIEKDSDLQTSLKVNKEILEMQDKLEQLQKKSQEISKIKENLAEQQNKIIENGKEGLSLNKEHERKIRSGKIKIYTNKISLKILELKRKISASKLDELSKNADEQNLDKLDCDSYLFTSMVLEYFVFFLLLVFIYGLLVAPLLFFITLMYLIIHPILVILRLSSCDSYKKTTLASAWKYLKKIFFVYCQLILIFFLFGILLFPGVLVLATQAICINFLSTQSYSNEMGDSNGISSLKVLMVIFFFFMSMKEVSSAFHGIAYLYKKSLEENLLTLLPIRILPQIFQILMCFWFCYINIYLIAEVEDTASLIQNFAALAIVLEFDNFVMNFLRYMKFYTFYKNIIDFFRSDLINCKSEKKMIKKNKNLKLEEYKNTLKAYENILNDLRKKNANATEYNPGTKLRDAKNKNERLKKNSPYLAASTPNENENNIKNEKLSDFASGLNEIFTENVYKVAITRIGKQTFLKILLTNNEFPINEKYNLNKNEKLIFNFLGILVVLSGILTIVLVFYEA